MNYPKSKSTTCAFQLRLTEEERRRLEELSRADGEATLSSFARKRLFASLSTELKLNHILELLEKNKERGDMKR